MGQEKVKKNLILNILTNALFVLALVFLGVVTLASIIYIESPIDGLSMAPTFNVNNDEKAFINKFKKGERGDVIVCNTHELDEEGNEVYIIKRIIAVAGDRVDIRYNEKNEVVVYLNGELLNEEYVVYHDRKNPLSNDDGFSYKSFKEYVTQNDVDYNSDGLLIEEGCIFIMGDNRSLSADSTKYGPFKVEDISGELAFVTKVDVNGKWAAIKYMFYKIFGASEKTGYIVSF